MKIPFQKSIIFCTTWLVLVSCTQGNKAQSGSTLSSSTEDSLKLNLEILSFKEVGLNPKADSIVRQWAIYLDMKNEVNRLKDYTIQDVISNISTLEKVVDSLQKTVPSEVDTFPVTSRINVLNTKAKYMLLLSEKQKPKLDELKTIAEQYPLEFNALKTQLNEIFIELPEFED